MPPWSGSSSKCQPSRLEPVAVEPAGSTLYAPAPAAAASSAASVVSEQPLPRKTFTPSDTFCGKSEGHCSHCMIGKNGFPSTTTCPFRTTAVCAAAAAGNASAARTASRRRIFTGATG